MRKELTASFIFRIVVSPDSRLRIIRHAFLWTTALSFMIETFYFLSSSIKDISNNSILIYTVLSTLLFGGLTLGIYWLITTLASRFILLQFWPGRFILGIVLIHLVASEIVLIHFKLFIKFATLPHLPRFYATYDQYIAQLPFWKAPFDVIIVFFFSFAFFYNYILYAVGFKVFKDLFAIQLQQLDLKKENLRLEYDFLRAQVNPHFLFNTLNNIYSFSVQAPQKVGPSLLKLADLMRYTLYETSVEMVSLREELIFLTSYLDLQSIRHDEHVQIQFKVIGEPGNQTIPPLLLITFVENAFKHGIQTSAQAAWVNIQISLTTKTLTLQVDNSVPAYKPETPPGIG